MMTTTEVEEVVMMTTTTVEMEEVVVMMTTTVEVEVVVMMTTTVEVEVVVVMTMSQRLSTRLLPLLSTSCLRVKREYTNLVEDAEI